MLPTLIQYSPATIVTREHLQAKAREPAFSEKVQVVSGERQNTWTELRERGLIILEREKRFVCGFEFCAEGD